jgi:hypothetical protein
MSTANNFEAARAMVAWGLDKAVPHLDTCEHEGKTYKCSTKVFTGRFGGKAAKAISEIGAGRVYLINTETHILWIEHAARYKSEYGLMRMGEVTYTEI